MPVEDAWYMTDKTTGDKVRTRRHGRGKRWRVRNRGARTVSFHKKSDAEAHDTVVKNDLLLGKVPFDHTKGRVLFETYAPACVKERYANENSRKKATSLLDNHLIPFYGKKRMCDIKPSTVSAGRSQVRNKPKKYGKPGEKLSASTVEQIDQLLVTIMLSAVKDKLIPANPCADATPVPKAVKRKVKVWEQETVNKVLDAVPERHYPIPLLSATCGHRPAESFGVAKGDIDFLRRRIAINHQVQRIGGQLALVPPKGGKVRTVPLPQITSLALAAHIKRHGTVPVRCNCCNVEHDVLFTSGGQLLARRDWDRDVWKPVVKSAGLTASQRTGQHQLRHFYVSTLIDGGSSIEQVAEYVGHASILVTSEVYGHLFDRSHDRARSIVDAAFSAGAYPMRTAQDQ